MRDLALVKSQASDDCGVCALSCLTGRDWVDVAEVVWPGVPPKKYGTSARDMVRGAYWLDWRTDQFSAKKMKYKRWDQVILDAGFKRAIVCVQYENADKAHFVVYDGRYVYDSNFDGPVTPDGYPYVPLSYIVFWPKDYDL